MDAVIDRLLSQSYLFDDPGAYEAGVRDAFDVFVAPLDSEDERRIVAAMREHPSMGTSQRLRAVRSSSAA